MSNDALVVALSAIIKGAVEPAGAVRILSAAPPEALARAVQQTDPSGNIARILTSILSQGNQTVPAVNAALGRLPNQPPPTNNSGREGSIGNAFWAGKRYGTVFGTPNAPMFKRIGQTNMNSSYRGWVLRPTDDPTRFEFVQKEYTGFGGGGNVSNAIKNHANNNVAAGLLAIIKGQVNVKAANQVVQAAPVQTPSMWQRLLTSVRRLSPTVNQTQKPANVNQTQKPANVNQTQKPANVNQIQKPAKKGPSLWSRVLGRRRNLAKPAEPTVSNLLRRKEPPTNAAIAEAVKSETKNLGKLPRADRVRRLGNLLKTIPEKFKDAREHIQRTILDEIRDIGRTENPAKALEGIQGVKESLGRAANGNIKYALDRETKRAIENMHQNEGYGQAGGESMKNYLKRLTAPRRYEYETEYNYTRRMSRMRREPNENNGEYIRRMEMYRRRRRETNAGYENRVTAANRRYQLEQNERMRQGARPGNVGNGVRPISVTATAIVSGVPGGAHEIGRAAEILNETNGNVRQAVNIKGASPVAVQAVQRLGGPEKAINTVMILEKSRRLRRRRTVTAPRRPSVRVKELKRVIKSVKKKKLISLVAHNVTKTHNIHENNKRLKAYYQKVIKAAILRTPLANIVKKSKAKK